MAMFDKKQVDTEPAQEQGAPNTGVQHQIVEEAAPVLQEVRDELSIFKTRVEHLRSLSPQATKTDVKNALIKVKRASMDVRDALKKVGQLKV